MIKHPDQRIPSERPGRGLRRGSLAAVTAMAGLGLTVAAAGLGTATPAVAIASAVPCLDVHVFVWDGGAGTNRWSDARNWDSDCVPGERFPVRAYDQEVHIPAGVTVALGDGESAHVGTLDNQGTLTVQQATLDTRSASTSHTLTLTDAFLVGKGSFTVTSSMTVTRAAQASRRCGWTEVVCSGPVASSDTGVTVVAPGATMVLDHYLNLDDQRAIDNRGTVTLQASGVIAADNGTSFVNSGTFEILNDRGYYQGNTPMWSLGRSTFVNTGVITKAGTGLSVVDAVFSGAGQVQVHSGDLSIPSLDTTALRQAVVGPGATFGNGAPEFCDALTGTNCSRVLPTAADTAVTTVQVPRTTSVSIRETRRNPSSGFLTAPVEIETPQAGATRRAPLYFTVLIDSTALRGKTAGRVAKRSPVQRKGSATPWATLPDCGTNQKPTRSQKTCVARILSAQKTRALGTGDAVIVISSLQNSRYRVGA